MAKTMPISEPKSSGFSPLPIAEKFTNKWRTDCVKEENVSGAESRGSPDRAVKKPQLA
jgi:hypothetical protein